MDCERCKEQKATVFLTQMIDGKMHKVDLCESCAKELEVSNSSGFSLTDLLLNIGAEKDMKAHMKDKSELTCPVCDYTMNDLNKTGRLGCWKCYEVFEDALKSVLREVHKGMQHRGKAPARQLQDIAGNQKLEDLERKLDTAVQNENYEAAAWLRDQIRTIKVG